MKTFLTRARRRTHGAVAVEFALLLPLLITICLPGMLMLGRFFWYYTVAEKTAHDVARFLATSSATEIKVYVGGSPPLIAAAKAIAQAEWADLPTDPGTPPNIRIECRTSSWDDCGASTTTTPSGVYVRVLVPFNDPIFPGFTQDLPPYGTVLLKTTALTDYVGN